MSSTVTADATVTIAVNDTETGGTLATDGLSLNFTETLKTSYNATSPNTAITKQWSGLLTLAVSTPQTLDLLSLAGPLSSTVTFASVVLVYVRNAGTHPVFIGNAATNPFTPGWGDATHVETLQANSRYFKEDNGTAWVVDSTHHSLMFDPSTFAGSVRVVILGN
jgi:hypothetical protein